MTIGNTMWIGVSGLMTHGEAISTVGDNIANVSTIGFKKSRASFNDMLGGEINGMARQGGGVYLGGNQSLWNQGTITQTGNPLDVGINGGGMFVVAGNSGGRDGQFYTRDGRFKMNESGRLVDMHGMSVQGYQITNGTRSASIGNLDLGARQSPAVATTKSSMTLNLDSDAQVIPTAFDPTNPSGTSNYTTSVTVYDSLGAAHKAEVSFKNNGTGNWEWHATVDGGEVGGTPGTPVEIANGTMTFDTDGKLQSQATLSSSASFTNATPNQVIDFNFGDDIASGGTGREGTQMQSGASIINAVDVDGRAYGNLQDVRIASDGTIEGVFDNGDTIAIAKLAVADFQSNEGLQRLGDSMYAATRDSGEAVIDEAGTGARGSLVAGALEQSNVDLSSELVQLIAYQRAFQANSKTVTTADEMMMEVTNLKR